jgi:hypothetical protein
MLGKFGRTPRFEFIGRNKPGRDDWSEVMSVLMVGGASPGSQVNGTGTSNPNSNPPGC